MEARDAGCRAISDLLSRGRTDRACQRASLEQLKTQNWATTDDQRRSAAEDLTADYTARLRRNRIVLLLVVVLVLENTANRGRGGERGRARKSSQDATNLAYSSADYTDMDRSEFVHGILHEVLWECEASSHRFSINGLLPQKRREDACALQKSRRLRDETQRAEICAGCENFHGSDFTKDSRCPFSTAERHRDYYGPVFARDNATFFSKSSHWLHRSTRWRSQILAAESTSAEV